MRLRVGAAMPEKGGRACVIGLEVRRGRDTKGRREWHYVVGQVDRVQPGTVEAAAARVRSMIEPVRALRPCVMVDVGSPQGLALRQLMRNDRENPWPRELHRPHAYPRDSREQLFAGFLEAYADGRVSFLPDLPYRDDLDRSLVFYLGGGAAKDGFELESEDEAMVRALGLALVWPSHGPEASTARPLSVTMQPEASDGSSTER